MGKLVQFEYTVIGKTYCSVGGSVIIDLSKAKIKGWKKERIWSDRIQGTVVETIYLIIWNGVEYGSFTPNEDALNDRCKTPPVDDDFMIFEEQFENIFE